VPHRQQRRRRTCTHANNQRICKHEREGSMELAWIDNDEE
jgi:hypothetical protein